MKTIDLRSDTVTQPTPAMRQAMVSAPVGDDVYQDDPTTRLLEERAAKILGKEAALFVTSGTMGNQLALMCQTNRGDEVIVGAHCHIVAHEVGAAAVLSGVNLRMLCFEADIPNAALIADAIRPDDIHEPRTALICLENALANGSVVTVKVMEEVAETAKKHKLPLHLDGARLFNAAVSLGVEVKALTKGCDTVSCCLSKGLCAPVGSVLAGSADVVAKARKYRKMLGGGMRQSGILAAAGLIALEEMPKRLEIDHKNAKYMAQQLERIPGVTVLNPEPQINMVFFRLQADQKVRDALPRLFAKKGIQINGCDSTGFRWVTHNGISREDIDTAVTLLGEKLSYK